MHHQQAIDKQDGKCKICSQFMRAFDITSLTINAGERLFLNTFSTWTIFPFVMIG